ncbi:MAG: hypothetical protein M3046_04815 [Actinomycetota bacterium]|nr:hypothetical protein [Actinomycetota bacterium]
MKNPSDSWWLKLKRAEKHLSDLNDYAAGFSEIWPYDTTLDVHAQEDRTDYIVRAFFRDPPDYTPAIIIGDFIHNIRSALDHIVAALTEPPELREQSAFPIYEENIWQEGFKAQRKAFKTATKGLPDYALAFVKQIQPYGRGQDAIRDPLALLKKFSNDDKHRQLIVTTRGIRQPTTTLRWPNGPILSQSQFGDTFEDGAVVAKFPVAGPPSDTEPRVHTHGPIAIAIKGGGTAYGGDFELPSALENILKYVWEYVILPLDTFVPS